MSSEWASKPISEVIDIISGGTPKTQEPSYWGGSIPWLSVVDFNNGNRYVTKAEKHITEAGLSKSATTMLQEGDIIISARGTVGALAQIGKPMAFNQSCYGVRGKNGLANTNFIYYLLKHSVQKLKNVSHGAVFDTITRQTFDLIDVKLPNYQEQEKIAEMLGCLDDRITLLRETNATLEAIAQAMFKSWFVDFDPVHAKQQGRAPEGMDEATAALFPDSFDESELGLVPRGWQISSLAKLMDIAGGTQPPASEFVETAKEGFIRLIQIRDYETDAHLTFLPFTSKLKITSKEDIMIARYGASVGRICWGLDGAYNVALVRVVCEPSYREFLRTYLQSYVFQERLAAVSGRSAQAGFNKSDIASFKLVEPTNSLFSAYQDLAWPLRKKILHNRQQVNTLVSLRDTLLPRLISGQIRLPVAEAILENAA